MKDLAIGLDFGKRPAFILVSATTKALVSVHVEFAGRDRRRIKREINKALRQVRLQHKANTAQRPDHRSRAPREAGAA